MEECVGRGEQKLSLASDCCRLSRSATFLITGLLCLAKHLLAPSRPFGLRLSPLHVLKLSGFVSLVRDQKRGAECISAGLSAVLHTVFHPSNLLALNEHHTLGKSSRTFPLAHMCAFAQDHSSAVLLPFLGCLPPSCAHLELILQLRNWAPRTLTERT